EAAGGAGQARPNDAPGVRQRPGQLAGELVRQSRPRDRPGDRRRALEARGRGLDRAAGGLADGPRPARRLRSQGELAAGLDPADGRVLRGLLRLAPPVSDAALRLARFAVVLVLPDLLQQGRDRDVGAARLSGARISARTNALDRLRAPSAPPPLAPAGARRLARARADRPGRAPDRPHHP